MVRVRATYVRRVAEMLRVRAAHECCACACIPGKPILSCRYPQAGHSEVDLRAVGELAEPAPLSLFGLGPTPHSLSGLGPPPTLTPWPDPECTPPSLTHSIYFTQIVNSMLPLQSDSDMRTRVTLYTQQYRFFLSLFSSTLTRAARHWIVAHRGSSQGEVRGNR